MKKIFLLFSLMIVAFLSVSLKTYASTKLTFEIEPTSVSEYTLENEAANLFESNLYINNILVIENGVLLENEYNINRLLDTGDAVLLSPIAEGTTTNHARITVNYSGTEDENILKYEPPLDQSYENFTFTYPLVISTTKANINSNIFENIGAIVTGFIGLLVAIFADNGVIGIFWDSTDGGSLSLLSNLLLIGFGFYIVRWAFKQIIKFLRLKGAI